MFFQTLSIRRYQRIGVVVIVILATLTLWHRPAFALPELPRVLLNTTYLPPTGQTIFVPAGGDFQGALNNAQPGDTITLEAGATFTGNFVLPSKGGQDWIVIRSSAPDISLPPEGTRITPSYSYVLPKIVSPNTSPAITTEAAAHHYRFIGVEITTTHSTTSSTLYNLIWLEYTGGQSSSSQAPTDIIFDRCYIHGTSTGNVRRGILLNSARTAIIDSYLSDFHEVGADSQAILGYNGPGPFKIVNNYLEGAGENVMFGGGNDPTIPNLVPSDIEIRGNHFYKPLYWRVGDPSYAGIHWSVKNLFELKNAQRVVIEENTFEHNWLDGQNGFGILFTVRNQNGGAPWAVVQDITFRWNTVRQSGSGVNILGQDNIYPSQRTKRILLQDNVFEDISRVRWGGSGILFQLLEGTADVVIDHNTAIHDGSVILADGAPHTGFVYINNITPHNQYGVTGTGTGTGNSTLNAYFPGYMFARNVLAGGNPSNYPADNFFPGSLDDVGFVNLPLGDYYLVPFSPYKNAATDGADVGVDFDGYIPGDYTPPDDTPPDGNVIWTNMVNVTASGNSLQKTSGCDGCADAGATSQQQIAGDGYVEFTASETGALRFLGLSNGTTSPNAAEIKFAIRLQAGWAEVRENGIYQWNTTFVTGDVFRVAVESGGVNYYKNGALFYTSGVTPTYPLSVSASLYNLYATITNAVIYSVP